MIIGDFNEILFSNEKFGGKPRNETLMHNFIVALERCYLSNLGHIDDHFMWNYKYENETFTK